MDGRGASQICEGDRYHDIVKEAARTLGGQLFEMGRGVRETATTTFPLEGASSATVQMPTFRISLKSSKAIAIRAAENHLLALLDELCVHFPREIEDRRKMALQLSGRPPSPGNTIVQAAEESVGDAIREALDYVFCKVDLPRLEAARAQTITHVGAEVHRVLDEALDTARLWERRAIDLRRENNELKVRLGLLKGKERRGRFRDLT